MRYDAERGIKRTWRFLSSFFFVRGFSLFPHQAREFFFHREVAGSERKIFGEQVWVFFLGTGSFFFIFLL